MQDNVFTVYSIYYLCGRDNVCAPLGQEMRVRDCLACSSMA